MIAVSTARADITPTAMAEMGGYATLTGPRLATGTYSPLMARVLILWDPDPHAIVTLDAGTLAPAWHQALRPRLVGLADWASADISILCTHTHNAPMTVSHPDPWITYGATDLSACEQYWDDLADTVFDLVSDALDAPQTTVTLDYQSIVQNWSSLRESLGYTETAVPVLAMRDATTGQPRAVLIGYGCHAVTAGEQTQWDGDYPAVACAVVEATYPNCHVQFAAGSGGDQDPVGTRGWALRAKLGSQLGVAAVAALGTPGRTLTGPITTSLTSVAVPLDVPANATERAARLATYAMRGTNPGGVYPAYYVRHSGVAIAQINAGIEPHTVEIPIQVWRLGGSSMLRMLFMGGEPVSGYGLWARNHYGGVSGVMVIGYANAVPCYVVGNPQLPPPLGLDNNGSYGGAHNTDDRRAVGESGCVYGMCWHLMPGLGPGSAEKTVIDALTAVLA